MSRLTWGVLTERFFETGVDRGVLYVGISAGVPWNGLVSVSESPTGGEPKPAYIDGYKFRNVASSEEFEATLDAFAAPKEFSPCDGSVSIQNGLIATQQPRRAFSLSYRTKVGNAVDGANHAYKIHLVYNALAAPAQRTNTTLSGSQGPNSLSWSLTTLPPSLTGYKPTAHWIIDSRTTPRGLLIAIEDIIYGTAAAEARMPLVSELVTLFKSEGPVVRTNLCTNPNMKTAGALVTTRTNLCANPSFEVDAVGWLAYGCTAVRDASSFDVGVASLKLTPDGVTAAPHARTESALGSLIPGLTYVMRVRVRASVAISSGVRCYIDQRNASGGIVTGTGSGPGVTIVPTAGSYVDVTTTFIAAATASLATIYLQYIGTPTSAQIVNIDAVIVEQSSVLRPYFDGATPAVLRRNLCTNPSFEVDLTGWPFAGTFTRDMTQFSTGVASMKASSPTAVNTYTYFECAAASAAPGDIWTLSADVKTPGTNGASWTMWAQVLDAAGVVLVTYTTALPATISAWTRYSIITPALPAGANRLRYSPLANNNTGVAGDVIFADAILIEKSPTVNPYFDGSTVTPGYVQSWEGAANASASKQIGADFTYAWSGAANASTSLEKALSVASWLPLNSVTYQSAVWAATTGEKSIAIRGTTSTDSGAFWNNDAGSIMPGIVAGNTYTVSATVNTPVSQTGTLSTRARTITMHTKVGTNAYVIVSSPAGPVTGSARVSVTFTAPIGMTECFVRLYNGADNSSANLVYWDEILIEQVSNDLPYFDGSTPDSNNNFYSWAGVADASVSNLNSWN